MKMMVIIMKMMTVKMN